MITIKTNALHPGNGSMKETCQETWNCDAKVEDNLSFFTVVYSVDWSDLLVWSSVVVFARKFVENDVPIVSSTLTCGCVTQQATVAAVSYK